MDDKVNKTHANRPFPKRPEDGYSAWQATMGYINTHHSPDALLQVEAYSQGDKVLWSASVSWADNRESVSDCFTLPIALQDLWMQLERHYRIFNTPADALRRPFGYKDDEWLDDATLDILHRLIHTTQSVFKDDWRILWIYQPSEIPEMRVQMRMLADSMSRHAGGRGANLLDAGRELFRNAAPIYQAFLEFRDNS